MNADTRDRVIAMEVEVEHLRAEVKALRGELISLREGISDLRQVIDALLNQAQGGKKVLGTLIGVGGFAAGFLANWNEVLGTLRGILK